MTPDQEMMTKFLTENGYTNIRFIGDEVIATQKFLFTHALILDIDMWGYGRRYCYNTAAEAKAACEAMVTVDDEPLPGYTRKM